MLNGIQLILTPIVCFEMKLECEMSCQNVNCDKILRKFCVKFMHRTGVYLDPVM